MLRVIHICGVMGIVAGVTLAPNGVESAELVTSHTSPDRTQRIVIKNPQAFGGLGSIEIWKLGSGEPVEVWKHFTHGEPPHFTTFVNWHGNEHIQLDLSAENPEDVLVHWPAKVVHTKAGWRFSTHWPSR